MARSANTNARVRVTADTRQAQAQMSRFRNGMKNTALGVFSDWKRMAVGITGVTTAIGAAGRVLSDFDAVNRNLIVGTGARGAGLRELFDITGDVASRVGIGLDAVSGLVAELDTTFPELRQQSSETFGAIAEDTAQLDFLFGQGFGSRAIRVFRAFTDDIDASRGAFDLLASLGTTTPGGLEPIIAFLDRYSARLERFNFDLDESLVLLSQLRRENINLRTFGTGLSIFAQRAVEEGRDPRELLFEVVDLVDSFTTSQERNNAAIEYFGAEASSAWLAAIDAGVLTLADLDQALIDSAGALDDLEARTTTATSLMSQAWSSFSSSIGTGLQSLVSSIQDAGIDLDELATRLGRGFASGITGLIPGVGQQRVSAGIGRGIGRDVNERGVLAGLVRQIPIAGRLASNLIVNINADTVIGGEDVGAEIAREIDRNAARSGVPPI